MSPSRHHRAGAARLFNGRGVDQPLFQLLTSMDADERREGLEEAQKIRGEVARRAMHQAIHTAAFAALSTREIRRTLELYAEIGGDKTTPILAHLLHSSHTEASVRIGAALALEYTGTLAAKKELWKARFCFANDVRAAAKSALARFKLRETPFQIEESVVPPPTPQLGAEILYTRKKAEPVAPIEIDLEGSTPELDIEVAGAAVRRLEAIERLPSSCFLGVVTPVPNDDYFMPVTEEINEEDTRVARRVSSVAMMPVARGPVNADRAALKASQNALLARAAVSLAGPENDPVTETMELH